ncbi:MAG: hypothetical protein ABIQ15_08600 [Nocardioides sp.]
MSPSLPHGPLRTLPPVQLARRVAIGIGLADVRDLEDRLAGVIEAADENTALERPLAEQVTRLEQSLVPLLRRRAKRQLPQ